MSHTRITMANELPCSLCGTRWCQKLLKVDCVMCKVAEDEETVEHRAQPVASTAVITLAVKVKQSRYGPGQGLRVLG